MRAKLARTLRKLALVSTREVKDPRSRLVLTALTYRRLKLEAPRTRDFCAKDPVRRGAARMLALSRAVDAVRAKLSKKKGPKPDATKLAADEAA